MDVHRNVIHKSPEWKQPCPSSHKSINKTWRMFNSILFTIERNEILPDAVTCANLETLGREAATEDRVGVSQSMCDLGQVNARRRRPGGFLGRGRCPGPGEPMGVTGCAWGSIGGIKHVLRLKSWSWCWLCKSGHTKSIELYTRNG